MMLKIQPDLQKAKALIKMARISLQRLDEINLYKYPTNTLTDCYEIMHKLMEALTLKEGIKIKGEGAHQELINYISKKYNFEEADHHFMQEMRDFRNRTAYEGFMITKEYIQTNLEKIKKIIKILEELFNKYL